MYLLLRKILIGSLLTKIEYDFVIDCTSCAFLELQMVFFGFGLSVSYA